jgi:hypothetical protein
MQKIGVIVGREWSFPPAFLEEVNDRNEGVVAEYVSLGGTRMDEPCEYAVIVDRISNEVPYYRAYLKNALLQGAHVVNNPFMWTADDKFFQASLATKLGLQSPRTVVLPNKDYRPGIVHNESLRNLQYPIPWRDHIEYLGGFPLVLKDVYGGGWKGVYVVHNEDELFWRYNESGMLTMMLQEYVRWDNYMHCMVIGQNDVNISKYDPVNRRYMRHDLDQPLYERIVHDSLQLVRALGYDMNTVEWAIRDGEPYVIDFLNPAPDMDINTCGVELHRWCVEKMADLCIRLAKSPRVQRTPFEI